jgi:hypothetical protein
MAALFARGREAGVCVLVATQELVDLDRASRGLRDQVLGNTTIKLVHRQDVPQSARMVAQMIGTEMIWEETHYIGAPFGYDTGRGTRRQVERFVVHPNTIMTLPQGQAVMIAKGQQASVQIVQVEPPARALAPDAVAATGQRSDSASKWRPAASRWVRATERDAARSPTPRSASPRDNGPELG